MDDRSLRYFVMANLGDPKALRARALQDGFDLTDIARVSGYSPQQLQAHFEKAGVEPPPGNPQSSAPAIGNPLTPPMQPAAQPTPGSGEAQASQAMTAAPDPTAQANAAQVAPGNLANQANAAQVANPSTQAPPPANPDVMARLGGDASAAKPAGLNPLGGGQPFGAGSGVSPQDAEQAAAVLRAMQAQVKPDQGNQNADDPNQAFAGGFNSVRNRQY